MRSLGQFQTFLLIFFFYEKILHAQKRKKHKTQTSDFYSDVFTRIKSLDVFYAHKNTVCFVLHKKA